jgi:hypothetical protein
MRKSLRPLCISGSPPVIEIFFTALFESLSISSSLLNSGSVSSTKCLLWQYLHRKLHPDVNTVQAALPVKLLRDNGSNPAIGK